MRGWEVHPPGAECKGCLCLSWSLGPCCHWRLPSGPSSMGLVVRVLPSLPPPASQTQWEPLGLQGWRAGWGQRARHLEAVSSPRVPGYLIIHHGEKGISISAVCFMRSPRCPAAVSKQHRLPSQQSWQRGLGPWRGGVPWRWQCLRWPSAQAPVSGSPPATPVGSGWEGRVATWAPAFFVSWERAQENAWKKSSSNFYFGLGSDCLAHSRSLRHRWASTSPGKGNKLHPFLPLPTMIFFFKSGLSGG